MTDSPTKRPPSAAHGRASGSIDSIARGPAPLGPAWPCRESRKTTYERAVCLREAKNVRAVAHLWAMCSSFQFFIELAQVFTLVTPSRFAQLPVQSCPPCARYKAVKREGRGAVSRTHYIVTKVDGPEAAGNDALASVVTHTDPSHRQSRRDAIRFRDRWARWQSSVRVAASRAMQSPQPSRSVTFSGTSTSSDIVVASAKAYLSAINRMIGYEQQNALLQGRKR